MAGLVINKRDSAFVKATPESVIGDVPMEDGLEGESVSKVIVVLALIEAVNAERDV